MRQSDKDTWKVIGFICLFTIGIHIINSFLYGQLNEFGVLPRHLSHFIGIVFYPFLHGSWGHLISNQISFIVLSYLVSRSGLARYMAVFIICWFGSGLGVWIFGRLNFHIGMSGVIYGLWAYLLLYAIMHRSAKSIAIALIVMFFYGSMIWGFIPAHSWISYESHFFGALTGAIAGFLFAKADKNRELLI